MNKTSKTMNYQIENGTCLIPMGTKSIEKGAFINSTELTHVVIPETVTEIGQNAFYGCTNLEEIRLSKSVKKIGLDAFAFCTDLSHIEVDDDNVVFDSRDNCNAIICKKTTHFFSVVQTPESPTRSPTLACQPLSDAPTLPISTSPPQSPALEAGSSMAVLSWQKCT